MPQGIESRLPPMIVLGSRRWWRIATAAKKHVERARIVLLSADGGGTLSIMGQVGCARGDGVARGRSLRGRGRRRAAAGQEPAAGQDAASSSTTTPHRSTPRCCAG
jgi:hypothetical protein